MRDSSQPALQPTIEFLLIHGTFARGADWTTEDADPKQFRGRLRAELGAERLRFEVFEWGHLGTRWRRLRDNRDDCRIAGGIQLRERLLALPDATIERPRYLVAHSHGGNVACYALRDPEVRSKVSGIVCIATPFLLYERSPIGQGLMLFAGVILILVAIDRSSIAWWCFTGVYLAVVMTMLVAGAFKEDAARTEENSQQLEALSIPGPDAGSARPFPRFLAIRPHRDEVAIVFWISRAAGAAFRGLWKAVNQVGGWLLSAFFLSAAVAMGLEALPGSIDLTRFLEIRSLVDRWVLTPMMLVVTGTLVAMAVLRWTFAFDSLRWLARIGVRSVILPWKGAEKVVIPTWGLLKHAAIKRHAPARIARWVREPESAPPTGSSPAPSS